MPGFVIEFNRRTRLRRVHQFSSAQEAMTYRLKRERERDDDDVEIAALTSSSLESLRRTHSRYFTGIEIKSPRDEMAPTAEGVPMDRISELARNLEAMPSPGAGISEALKAQIESFEVVSAAFYERLHDRVDSQRSDLMQSINDATRNLSEQLRKGALGAVAAVHTIGDETESTA